MAERELTSRALDGGTARRLTTAVDVPAPLAPAPSAAVPRAVQPLLLRFGVLNSVFLLALVAARLVYHGQVHPVAYVAVAVVLAVYAAGAAQALRMARWRSETGDVAERAWQQGLVRLDRLAARCPKVAMAGTVTGFLIAFSASTDDVAGRVRGASTGLAATLIGIAAMLLLELQHDWLAGHRETN